MTTSLHEDRLRAVLEVVRQSGARRAVDLGCGDGDLFVRLATTKGIERLAGLDICAALLDRFGCGWPGCRPVVRRSICGSPR